MPAGALNLSAGNMPSMPAMPFQDSPQNYVGGGGALSGTGAGPVYQTMPGVDPRLYAIMEGASGPVSPFAQQLSDTARGLIGDPQQSAGALTSAQSAYDSETQAKKAAISRAYAKLSGADNDGYNLPALAFGSGMGQPGGNFGNSLARGAAAAIPVIQQQREASERLAQILGNLDIAGPEAGQQGALQDANFVEKKLGLADTAENQAGQIQSRSDIANANRQRNVLQYAGRVGAAELTSNKGRYKFIGNDPNDPTTGQYLDQTSGQTIAGPAASGTSAGGRPSVFQERQQAWLAIHKGDTAGALDYAAGHKNLTPEEMRRSAYTLAQSNLGTGADQQDVANMASQIYGRISGGFDSAPAATGNPAPSGGQASPPKAAPPSNFKKAPDGFFYAPDPARPGKYLKWTG